MDLSWPKGATVNDSIHKCKYLDTYFSIKIKISCDNLEAVEVINSGKTRDEFLATCARKIWLLSAIFNIQLIMVHIPGKCNLIADILSRWVTTNNAQQKLEQLLPEYI